MAKPNFLSGSHFRVEWGGERIGFSEVSGLDIMVDTIEYREGNSPVNSSIKLPGRIHYSNITLKRGVLAGDSEFFKWIRTIQFSEVEKRDVTISLLDENHEPAMVWQIQNAFPVKLIGPTLSGSGNEIAIETIELAHEGLIIVI